MAQAPKVKKYIIDEDLSENESPEQNLLASGDINSAGSLENYISEINSVIKDQVQTSCQSITPWFFKNMPHVYYQTTPRQEKILHLSAIISSHLFETKQTLSLWSPDRSKVNYIGPGGDTVVLHELGLKLTELKIKMGSLYLSLDEALFVSTFFCNEPVPLEGDNPRIQEKIKAARENIAEEFPEDISDLNHYLNNLDNDFVTNATPARIQLVYRMMRTMRNQEGANTIFEEVPNRPTARITLGLRNISSTEAFEQALNLISRYGAKLTRCFMVTFTKGYVKPISILHFHIASQVSGEKVSADSIPMIKLNKALRTIGWVDRDDYTQFMQPQYGFSINAVNFVRSLSSWLTIMLGKYNPYYYSQYKIRTTFFSYAELTKELTNLFRIKFDPLRGTLKIGRGYTKAKDEINEKIALLNDEVERNIFRTCVHFIDHIQKTNYFLQTKTGLAFRLSPDVLDPKYYPERPFSIFYICGRDYRMFHTRWKDISRGGVRVVIPKTQSDYDYSLSGIYDEVYGLSYAQQLKNKDIPEGGSKGVLLLKPGGDRVQAVRGGVNAFLDLLVSDDESHQESSDTVVSYTDAKDIIYLGPDENITNDLLEWIPQQAARRGYPYAAAFMSSKPGAGINHKHYGVTSEGLNVYVDNILHYLDMDPRKTKFTVRITGGPDGDVAGNELNILHREYGENARVVGIADGFGAARDDEGLDWQELLRLFRAGLSICEFDTAKLSGHVNSYVIKADTQENIKIRNELHARVPADLFLPCGGRPYTVTDKNWSNFLDENGRPTCKAIVEGANIFFTKEARQKLQEQGILMIKDSSANKTGVICSSYEIIASLTISESEFLEIKEEYVKQVIGILRQKADWEAKLLFHEYKKSSASRMLVDLSMDISLEINNVTDTLLEELTSRSETILKDDFYNQLILKHCPPLLVEKYSERILAKLPPAHKIAILSASIASSIVYREGLGWLSKLSKKDKVSACLAYVKNDILTQNIIATVRASDLPNKDKIVTILAMSSTRDLTTLNLEAL